MRSTLTGVATEATKQPRPARQPRPGAGPGRGRGRQQPVRGGGAHLLLLQLAHQPHTHQAGDPDTTGTDQSHAQVVTVTYTTMVHQEMYDNRNPGISAPLASRILGVHPGAGRTCHNFIILAINI